MSHDAGHRRSGLAGPHRRGADRGWIWSAVVALGLAGMVHPHAWAQADAAGTASADAAEMSPADGGSDAGMDGEPLPELDSSGLHFEFVVGAWLARNGGEVTLGDGNAEFLVDQAIDNDEIEVTPLIEVDLRDDDGFLKWRVHGFVFSSSADGRANEAFSYGSLDFVSGDLYSTKTEIASAGVEWVASRWTKVGLREGDAGDVRLDLMGILNGRWVRVEQRITEVGVGSEARDGDWFTAGGAFRFELEWAPVGGLLLGESLRLSGEVGANYAFNNDGGAHWHVRAGVELRFDAHWSAYFGYRLLELGVEDDDWQYDAGLQGLFVGVSARF